MIKDKLSSWTDLLSHVEYLETPDNLFVAPVNIEIIESFMHMVGNKGVVDNKKDVIQYPRFTKLIIVDLMKKYPSIPQRVDDDYHSIKDDIPLDCKEYETVFVRVDVPMNQPQPIVSTQGTHRTTPRAHKTPTLTTASPQRKKRKQSAGETSSPRKSLKVTIRLNKQSTTPIPPSSDDRERDEIAEATLLKLAKEEIEKMVEGEEDEESYASEFADSMFNDDVDDSGTRIEPEIHKENPELVDEYEVNDKVKQDEINDDDVEKPDDVVEEKENDDQIDHTSVETHVMGSMETRNEQMQTPIPTLTRSPRKDISLDKTIYEELTIKVSPTTATTSKDSSKSKSKKGFTSNKTKILSRSIAGMCRRRDADPPEGGRKGRKDILVTIDKPTTDLIYLNSKDEKWDRYLVEIVKFYDATLEKVFNEVKLRISQNQLWKKLPWLGELDLDIMGAFEREMSKHLSH
nr:hypothetical protein [Tanacetum cinerariifolium]